ncbi:MAG: acetate uptake transporter [Firmicutes bacterium]|nr:acetate uptake transporter [Bacillota bacterium]
MCEQNTVRAEVSQVAATADPAPLGLGGFALTTFVLSMSNAKFVVGEAFLGLAFFYGGLAQLLAGMQEYKKNNVFGATAFSTYGAFWMSLALMTLLVACGVPVKWGGSLTGIFLIGFTIFNTYMWIGSFRVSVAVCAIFTTLEITFILLDLAEFGLISSVPGGIMGIICAFTAWYTSAAGVLNTVYKRTVLPVGPLSK